MQKLLTLSLALVAGAVSVPAEAEVLRGLFNRNEEIIGGDYMSAPAQSTMVDGAYGYPFYGGCCEDRSACCDGLWDGYCGKRHCGWFHRKRLAYGHGHGCDSCPYGYDTCGPTCGHKRHGWWGKRHYGKCGHHAYKGYVGFDHGCSSCKGGKGGAIYYGSPAYGSPTYGSPVESYDAEPLEAAPQPAEIPVPPTPESSAFRLFRGPRFQPASL